MEHNRNRAFRSVVMLACSVAAAGCGQSAVALPDGPSPDASPADGGLGDGPVAAPDAVSPDAGPSEVVTACPLVQLGSLDSLFGGAVGVGPDTLLVVTGQGASHLHLVARRGAALVTLASTRLPALGIDVSQVVAQALDGGLIAVGERGERDLSLVSVAPAALEARATVELDGQLVSVTGHGSRLWLCTRDFLNGPFVSLIDVSDPDAPLALGGIRLPSDCGSLASSDDGKRIYVNTADGVRFIDATPLDTGGNPTLADVFAPMAGVTAGAGYLVLRGADTVRVLTEGDHTEVASVASSGALAASLAGNRLLIEGFRTVGSGTEGYIALWDVLGATPPEKLDEVVLFTSNVIGDPPPSFRSAVTFDGSTVIARLGARLFDLTQGRLDEIRVPELTPLDQLYSSGSGSSVRAFGQTGVALVDVSDPSAPAFAGGGSFGVPSSFAPALDETTATPHILFASRSEDPGQSTIGRPWEPHPQPVTHWRLDGDDRAQITGSFLLPSPGPAQLLVAGDALYSLRVPVSPSFDVGLRGFALASLGSAGELAQPSFDITLSPSPPLMPDPKSDFGIFGAFDVDPEARLAVVSTGKPRFGAGADAALFWIDLASSPPKVIEEVHLSELPRHLRIAGTRAVGLTGLDILFFELGRGQVSQVSSGESFLDHILSFDGRIVTYGQSLPYGLGVAGFGSSGPPPAPLLLDDVPRSLVATDHALVVGLPGQLVTVEPSCL